jgi:hypothetical protein
MIAKNSFPNSTEMERMKTLENYTKLYDNQQQEVLLLHQLIRKQYKNAEDIVYLGHAIPAKVSDFYGDFVQGDVERMTLDYLDDEGQREVFEQIVEDNEVEERINDWATEQSISGYQVLLGYVADNKFYIQDVDPDQYFPQGDTVIFATYFRDTQNANPAVDEGEAKLLLYTQEYSVVNGQCQIERKVWTTDAEGKNETALGDEVLKAYFGDVKPLETIEGLDEIPVVQINNGRMTKWGFGKSDYCDIMPQLAEVNERRTHVATALLKNLDAKLELPERDDLKGDNGQLKYFEYIMRADKNEPETRYITNDNPLLEASEIHIKSQLSMISYITDVPMWALLDGSAPERVESMKIKLFSAIRKTNRKRAKMTKGIEKIVEIGFKMLGKEMAGTVYLQYSDVLPNDEFVDAQTEEIKVRAGVSSKRSAMKRLENYSEEELDDEEKQIKKEGISSGAVDPNNAPGIDDVPEPAPVA